VRAEILTIGTELLLGQIHDTNAAVIAEALADAGIDVCFAAKVGDNQVRIVEAFRQALARSDAVVATGGLGPTQDDITREAMAEVMGVSMHHDADVEQFIRKAFASRNRPMPDNNLRQAQVPDGATVIAPVGTAPGLICPVDGKVAYLVPGVPWEMTSMLHSAVLPDLTSRAGEGRVIVSRVLRTWGSSESRLAEMLADRFSALEAAGNPTMAFLAGGGEIRIRLTASAPAREEAEALLEGEELKVREIVGSLVFGVDDESMATVLGGLLQARGQTVAVAESLTGGLLADRLSEVPGASDWFAGGVVSYRADVKRSVLGCRPDQVEGDAVVSEDTAMQMARGVASLFDADWAIGLTGEAGPDAATSHPRGTVCFGWVGPDGIEGSLTTRLPGDRRRVQEFSAATAINLLRLAVSGESPRPPFR